MHDFGLGRRLVAEGLGTAMLPGRRFLSSVAR